MLRGTRVMMGAEAREFVDAANKVREFLHQPQL